MIEAVLFDLSGVLYVDNQALPGAVDAIKKINQCGIPVRYITNTTRSPQKVILGRLEKMGFDISSQHLFTAPIATHAYLKGNKLFPYLLVHPDLEQDFTDLVSDNPNAVVLGDAAQKFSYDNLNKAFRILMKGAPLIAMGKNQYFREENELSLDMGPFVAALEFAANTESIIIGKPANTFFKTVVNNLGCQAKNIVMVGDDVKSDVIGGLDAGLQGILVRTGKYQKGDDEQLQGKGLCVDDISEAVDWIVSKTL